MHIIDILYKPRMNSPIVIINIPPLAVVVDAVDWSKWWIYTLELFLNEISFEKVQKKRKNNINTQNDYVFVNVKKKNKYNINAPFLFYVFSNAHAAYTYKQRTVCPSVAYVTLLYTMKF